MSPYPHISTMMCAAKSRGSGDILDQMFSSTDSAWWVVRERGRNFLTYSEDFTAADWSEENATLSTTGLTFDGSDVFEIVQDSGGIASSNAGINQRTSGTGSGSWIVSVHAKANAADWLVIGLDNNLGYTASASFDLANGVTGALGAHPDVASDPSSGMESLGDGWYRCWFLIGDVDYVSIPHMRICGSTAEGSSPHSRTVTGDGTSGVYVTRAQVEFASAPTEYEATTEDALAGAMLDGTGGGRHMLLPGGTANPVLLDHDEEDYFWSPGTADNKIEVAYDPAHQIAGDQEYIFHARTEDFAASPAARLAGAWGVGGNRVAIEYTTIGEPRIYIGGAAFSATAPITTVFANGEDYWLKIVVDADNGAGGWDVLFYTSPDGTTWTQLGATVTRAGTFTIVTSTAAYQLFGYSTQAGVTPQRIYRAIIKDGIDGTVVLDVNAADADPDSDTFTEASANAATVTINRSTSGYVTQVVDQPKYTLATDDCLYANYDPVFNVGASDSFTAVLVGALADTNSTYFLLSNKANTSITPGYLLQNLNNTRQYGRLCDGSSLASAVGVSPGAPENVTVALAMTVDRGTDEMITYVDGVGGTATDISSIGDTSNANDLVLGAGSNKDTNFMDGTILGAAFIKKALTAAEIAEVGEALITRNGGTP